jgi:rubrerythrin
MFGTTWLAYFEGNARDDREPAPALASELTRAVHAPLSCSLGRFQLGESAGGKIHEEISSLRDRTLDPETRRAIQLYIEEEWRHARELALVIQALGGELQRAHWTNSAFTACRRFLGLRTKMMTLAVAEVVGIVYYRALARGLGSPALAASLTRIAAEEGRHLDFQAAFFQRALNLTPRPLRRLYQWALAALALAVLLAACAVLWVDHGALLRRAGVGFRAVCAACFHELTSRRFLRSPERATPALRFGHG